MSLSILVWQPQLSEILGRRHGSRPTHLPGPLESMGPYRYMCCSTSSYAAWPWIGPLMDGGTHPTASWMPLPGTTKPSPYHWLAIMSKNHVICTKQLLLLGKHYEWAKNIERYYECIMSRTCQNTWCVFYEQARLEYVFIMSYAGNDYE